MVNNFTPAICSPITKLPAERQSVFEVILGKKMAILYTKCPSYCEIRCSHTPALCRSTLIVTPSHSCILIRRPGHLLGFLRRSEALMKFLMVDQGAVLQKEMSGLVKLCDDDCIRFLGGNHG